MLSVTNISYFIGGRALYQNASMFIKPNDKVGLIGLNGKGKSTLLKIIEGQLSLDQGAISKAKECTIGFLNQDLLSYQSDDAIITVAMEAFKDAVDTQRQLEQTLHLLEHEYSDDLVDKLARLQEKFERLDGYTMQSKAEEVLEGIGFSTVDLHRPLREFSGGWRMRVMLAKLLLEKPSLLLLDEPTNHLDLPSIEWVENYLRNYPGAVVIVSHDRRFLDEVSTKTVEVTNEQLVTYEGNYSFYQAEKEQREQIQQNAFDNQQQKIKQAERFITRFRAKSTKAKQVQSRIKALDRMDLVDEVVNDNAVVNFRFTFSQKSGRHVMQLKDLAKSFGDNTIFRNTDVSVERKDKIALIGANGKGKSTLLRIIAGTEPIEGERTQGHNVIMGFYAQHQLESLDTENEILDELKQAGSGKTEQELRNVLGCFLFSDDDAFKKIKVLSGGEKSRVALAKTLISEANFLLLDEPTNHLDFLSENILVQALQQYQGSFVIVSHDRDFVSQVANKIWYIENFQLKEFPGTYEEYEYWKNNIKQQVEESKVFAKPRNQKKESPYSDNEKLLKTLNKQVIKVEAHILTLEEHKKSLEKELTKSDVFGDFEKLQKVNEKIQQIDQTLDAENIEWAQLLEQMDAIKSGT